MNPKDEMIYLDHQASTPMHPAAAQALTASAIEHIANPHASDHASGWAAAKAIDDARADVGQAIGGDPDEIIFTSGATEADNMALLGLAESRVGRTRIIVGAMEHKAVLGPARHLVRYGFEVVVAPAARDGTLDAESLAALVDDKTLLVSLMLVNNEIGTVQPVTRAADACAQAGALLHVDAAQALSWMPIDAYTLGADMVSLSAHKMGGPKGIGALFVRREVRDRLRPILYGGEQEDGLRPGTLPTPLCVAFAAACRNRPSPTEVAEWRGRTKRLQNTLLSLVPGAWVNGVDRERHPGAISVTFPGIDAEALIARLQPRVAVSRGSACTSGVPEPSHVLRAIGLAPEDCDATVRVSTGRFTTDAEIDAAAKAFADAIAGAGSEHRQI